MHGLRAALLLCASTAGHGAERDSFGIAKIYADAPPPSNYWLFTGDAHDPRFFEQHVVPLGDGWFRPSGPKQMRLEILSDAAANERTIPTFNISKVLARGYLFKAPNSLHGKGDFLNLEQTWRTRRCRSVTKP